MLTFRQMDSIVHNTLLIFEGFEINRREEGTNIFYDVQDSLESGKRVLGTYRVWEWHDGSGRSQWTPLKTNDSEITRIRHIVWEAIMAIAVPANQSTENVAALPANAGEKKRESIINSAFATVKDDIENYLWKRGRELNLSFKSYKIELPEGQAYDINHSAYGELGQLSIHPRENETRLRFTKPGIPKQDESMAAFLQAGHNVPKNAFDAVDWVLQQREKENQTFYNNLLKYFEEVMPVQAAQSDMLRLATKQRGKSGRPHLQGDIWAWEQVTTYNRPRTEVYKEWLEREDVKARNLQDPERQFDRITKSEWGNK